MEHSQEVPGFRRRMGEQRWKLKRALHKSSTVEFRDDLLHDRRNFRLIGRRCRRINGAAADWLVCESMSRQHALQFIAECTEVGALF